MGIDEIYVRDKNLNKIGLIENAESIIWTNRFFECGDFEIYAPASKKILNLCKTGRFLTHKGSKVPMMIEEYKITTDLDGIDYITISGRCATGLLSRRIIVDGATRPEEYPSVRIFNLLNNNIIFLPGEASELAWADIRRINKLKFSDELLETDKNTYPEGEYLGQNLYQVVTDICKTAGFGIKTHLEFTEDSSGVEKEGSGYLDIILYSGLDLSKKQNDLPPVVFSPSYGNLAESEYGVSWTNYANTAVEYMTVSQHGTNVIFQSISSGITGLNRYETFVNLSDLATTWYDKDFDKYRALADTRVNETLANHGQNVAFDGKVVFSESFEYGVDYKLGDIVTMENEYGASETLRVVEVIESLDSNGYIITPVLKGVTETTN